MRRKSGPPSRPLNFKQYCIDFKAELRSKRERGELTRGLVVECFVMIIVLVLCRLLLLFLSRVVVCQKINIKPTQINFYYDTSEFDQALLQFEVEKVADESTPWCLPGLPWFDESKNTSKIGDGERLSNSQVAKKVVMEHEKSQVGAFLLVDLHLNLDLDVQRTDKDNKDGVRRLANALLVLRGYGYTNSVHVHPRTALLHKEQGNAVFLDNLYGCWSLVAAVRRMLDYKGITMPSVERPTELTERLHTAAACGDLAAAREVLAAARNADGQFVDASGQLTLDVDTPWHEPGAAQVGFYEPAVLLAVRGGHAEMVDLLVENGARLAFPSSTQRYSCTPSPVSAACFHSQAGVLRLLLTKHHLSATEASSRRPACPRRNTYSRSDAVFPFEVAIERKSLECVMLLVKHGAAQTHTAVLQAFSLAANEKNASVGAFLDVLPASEHSENALMYVAEVGDATLVRALVEHRTHALLRRAATHRRLLLTQIRRAERSTNVCSPATLQLLKDWCALRIRDRLIETCLGFSGESANVILFYQLTVACLFFSFHDLVSSRLARSSRFGSVCVSALCG